MTRKEAIKETLMWMCEQHAMGKLTAGEYNTIYVAMGFDLQPVNGSWFARTWWKLFGRKE